MRNKLGGLTMLDYAYLDRPATDGTIRPNDDKVPQRLAEMFRTSVTSVPMSMEGGNLLTNGFGICISTSQLVNENSHRKYGMTEVGGILKNFFGQLQWASLDHLPPDDTHHADTYVMFTSPDTVVVGSCDPKDDAVSAAVMDRAADQLGKIIFDGKPLRIVRIPMKLTGDSVIRTYTNVVFANGTLLVPQYADVPKEMNDQALRIYRETMPGWNVVGIECLSVARKGGSLHCITCNVPSPSLMPLELGK
ncbi:MAG: agmatine deiminase family protein [Pirellulales bacterium]